MNKKTTFRSAGRRAGLAALLTCLALVLATGVVALVGNTFSVEEQQVSIPVPGGHLEGVLAWPEGARPTEDGAGSLVGVVVFVHGDGPVDATSDGFYRPIWDALADAGYASLSWSKPGVDGSSGDWLAQSMDDRADEVEAALDWVASQPGIDPDRVGLWGASQGGWVVPAVAAERDDVAFTVLVSPAISWLRQGRFNTLAQLDHDGASQAERDEALAVSDDSRRLLAEGADYARYRAETIDPEPMDEARWGFVSLNVHADATADLTTMGTKGVPTLLVVGGDDLNVDVDETRRVYEDLLGDALTVRFFDGARHTLARPAVEDSTLWGLAVGVLAPRQVFVPGYLDAQRDFLETLG